MFHFIHFKEKRFCFINTRTNSENARDITAICVNESCEKERDLIRFNIYIYIYVHG